MDTTSFILIAIGVALSVLGFFLKRLVEEVDVIKTRSTRIEIQQARNFEKIQNLEKLLEDRRDDIKNLFEKL